MSAGGGVKNSVGSGAWETIASKQSDGVADDAFYHFKDVLASSEPQQYEYKICVLSADGTIDNGLDFNALDRGLTAEERQEWNSIYASYRGRSAVSRHHKCVSFVAYLHDSRQVQNASFISSRSKQLLKTPFRKIVKEPKGREGWQGKDQSSPKLSQEL